VNFEDAMGINHTMREKTPNRAKRPQKAGTLRSTPNIFKEWKNGQ
jgi:hypothetical protein